MVSLKDYVYILMNPYSKKGEIKIEITSNKKDIVDRKVREENASGNPSKVYAYFELPSGYSQEIEDLFYGEVGETPTYNGCVHIDPEEAKKSLKLIVNKILEAYNSAVFFLKLNNKKERK